MDRALQWAVARIVEKVTPQFYGSITLSFQGGKLHSIKTEETEKPPAC